MATLGSNTARQISPRLADLKREHDAAHATRIALEVAPPTGADEEFEEAFNLETELARRILAEPVAGLADFAIKVSVWETTVRDEQDDEEDITQPSGWIDRALPRLFNDARALLASAAVAP